MSSLGNPEGGIVDAALALPPAERAAYLDQACGQDTELRRLVTGLLRAHEHAPARREPPNSQVRGTTTAPPFTLAEKAGDRIGRYKLLQQVGEGGWGVVYMAEQEEPVRRRVALKVIKLGMDTKQVIARFEAERQALALMDHPNIAKVLDAGATTTGRPYFVMELVRGIKITDYCDQNSLPTAKRLELFIQVCKAIQHAHQKGVIHRDIKPSNILVTLHDGVPVPKVIDFGIAKAASGQRLTDQTLFTAFEQFIGTPAYMSPEQAEMSGLDIDTRSDIYSLGVLLYELLTDKVPFEPTELAAAGLDEIRRIIREKEPVKPSTRLSTLSAAEQTTVARCRQTEPPRLIHLVRGDLDWIVMKCLEKDRTRRYETANGLASDLQRHLDNEPVAARPPTRWYQFQKLARRNKAFFVAAGAVGAALVLGLIASTWEAVRAKHAEREQSRLREAAQRSQANESRLRQEAETQRQAAQTQAAKSQEVARLLEEMLQGVGPSVARGRDTTLLREILDKTDQRVSQELTNQPEVEAEVRTHLGRTYGDLGISALAEVQFARVLELRRKELGKTHPETVHSMLNLADTLTGESKFAEAENLLREILQISKKDFGDESVETAGALHILGNVYKGKGEFTNAVTSLREAVRLKTKLLGTNDMRLSNALIALGGAYQSNKEFGPAAMEFERAMGLVRRLEGEESLQFAFALGCLALCRFDQGLPAEGESLLRKSIEINRTLTPDGAHLLELLGILRGLLDKQGRLAEEQSVFRDLLAVAEKTEGLPWIRSICGDLARQGKFAELEPLLRRALALQRKLSRTDSQEVLQTLDWLCATLENEGKQTELESTLRERLALQRKACGDSAQETLPTLQWLCDALQRQGKLHDAELQLRDVLALQRKLLGNDSQEALNTLDWLAGVLVGEGKLAEAEALAREGLALGEKRFPDDWRTFSTRATLGTALLEQKKYGESEPMLISGYEGMKQRESKLPDVDRPRLKGALFALALLYEETSRPEQAALWRSKLTELDKK